MEPKKLLYEVVYDAIKEQITSGAYQDGELLPSERVIGEKHNVDRSTVRKALQRLVDDRLVVKHAGVGTKVCRDSECRDPREIGAKPRSRNETLGTIGFFLPPSVHRRDRISQPFYSSLFYHIEQECRANGYACLYSTLDEHDDFQQMLEQQHFNGIIFVSNTMEKFIQMAIDAKIPSVLVNEYNPKLPCYLPDNTNGMIMMCEYLIGLGHRRFALIMGIDTYLTSRERYIGCTYAFAKHNIPEPYVANCDWEPNTAFRITKELLETTDPMPTVIIGFNDNIAIGCLAAANELGLRVPEDISIVGFDDIEQSRYAIPPLTTVHGNIKELALATMQGLLLQIQLSGALTSLKSYVSSSLMIRESTAPPPTQVL